MALRGGGPAGAALLAVLVALAGCGGGGEAVGPEGTVTPAPVPGEDPTATAAAPPGVSAAGVGNASALVAAHRALLRGASYTVCRTERVTVAGGTLIRERMTALRVGSNRSRFYAVHVDRGGWPSEAPRRVELWSDGDVLLVAREPGSAPARYETHPAAVFDQRPAPFDDRAFDFVELSSLPTVRAFLAAVETRGVRRTDGERGFRVTGTADRLDGAVLPGTPAGVSGGGNGVAVRNVSVEAWVTPEGLVRGFRVRYDAVAAPGTADGDTPGAADGIPVRVVRTVRYADVGATAVDRPWWYGVAVNGTGAAVGTTPTEPQAGAGACGRAGESPPDDNG